MQHEGFMVKIKVRNKSSNLLKAYPIPSPKYLPDINSAVVHTILEKKKPRLSS